MKRLLEISFLPSLKELRKSQLRSLLTSAHCCRLFVDRSKDVRAARTTISGARHISFARDTADYEPVIDPLNSATQRSLFRTPTKNIH